MTNNTVTSVEGDEDELKDSDDSNDEVLEEE